MPERPLEQLLAELKPKPNPRACVGEAKEPTTVGVTGKLQAWTALATAQRQAQASHWRQALTAGSAGPRV